MKSGVVIVPLKRPLELNTPHALRLAAMELKYLMLVSTRKWLTAGTPLALLKCNRCIAPAIGRLYGAGRTNMKKLLAILLLTAACFTATAQSDIDYPYNPDFENDGFVGIEDVLELLSVKT